MMNKNHEIYKHKHICLVEDHYNPLGIVRSLGEEGIKPIVLLCNKKPHLVNYSKYIGELHKFASIEEGYQYLVEHYSNEELKPFIYNGSDNITLLLDSHYDELKDRFYFTNGSGTIKTFMQKYDITKLAEECGITIPREELLKVGEMPNTLRYPVFTKAVTSANGGDWKAQAFLCHDEKELKDAYVHIESEQILVQEYIKKKNELCIDGISINGGEEVFMPYACNYFRFPSTSYGCYMYFFPFKDDILIRKIKEVIRGAHFTGIFCVEFMIGQDDDHYFLEVNFRNSGWSYAFTYGGFNLPFRWAVSTLDNNLYLDDFNPKDRFTALSEIEDLRSSVVQEKMISIYQWIKDFFNTDVYYVWNRRDPKPMLGEIWFNIKHQFKKRILRTE